jgi:uncharacterized protein
MFAVRCLDVPGTDIRSKFMPEHKTHLLAEEQRIMSAGPLLDDANQMIGSLLILDFPDVEAVTAFLDNDPFQRAGLYASRTIDRYHISWERLSRQP